MADFQTQLDDVDATSVDSGFPLVVVIDDSTTSITAYQLSLKSSPISLRCFTTAAEASAFLEQNRPRLILLDILMPDVDGLTLLKRLRRHAAHHDTPIVVATSKDYAQDRKIAADLGVREFIVKPLRFSEIRELISRYVN